MTPAAASAASEYRLTGRFRLEAMLLPFARLIVALPWAVANVVILRSLVVLVGLWAAIAVVVVRVLAWLFMRVFTWVLPDDESRLRSIREHPDEAVYPAEFEGPLATLIAARRDVLHAAGMPESRLRLMVRDQSQLRGTRAHSHAHRMVVVSTQAIRDLPPLQLRAVVAHEFGHHVIGGWTLNAIETLCATTTLKIFAGPMKLLIETLPRRERWTAYHALVLLLAFPIPFVPLVALMIPAIDIRYACILAIICDLQLFPMMWLSWREEYLADKVVADLGYGPPLREMLSAFTRRYDSRFTVLHPSTAARIARISRRIEQGEAATHPR
ncbi:M48 family metalloprotease [Nocardia sp. NPDC058058]|uniref:M48 family metalloprotease n=1 Tax=Nocardia sp. NPDC058058 TaxID=3346317 RepID=UPI0036DC1E8B